MAHKREKLLLDIVEAGMAIHSFIKGRSLEEYGSDHLLRSGVERQFLIVGEALARLKRLDGELAERIRDHQRIISFRNIVVHGYDEIDDMLVWGVIEDDLPRLLTEAQALLDELQASK